MASTSTGIALPGFLPGSTAATAGGSSMILGVLAAGELAAGLLIVSGARELEVDLATLATLATAAAGAGGETATGD